MINRFHRLEIGALKCFKVGDWVGGAVAHPIPHNISEFYHLPSDRQTVTIL